MREWLSTELLLATLLVTTFTCVGMLALWAATSQRHWFICVAVVFVIFSPTLIIPARGLLLTVVLEVLLVAIVFALLGFVRRWRERRHDKSSNVKVQTPRWQFSIKSAFALFVCVAVMSAIIASIPENPFRSWSMIATAATAAATITALAAWVVVGKSKLVVRAAGAICFVAALVGLQTVYNDGGEIHSPMLGAVMFAFFPIDENQVRFLALTAIGLFAALILTLLLVRAVVSSRSAEETVRQRPVARLALAAWLLFIMTPPTVSLVALLQSLPVVDTTLPNPNGYDELVAIGNRFDNSDISKELVQFPTDTGRLDAAVTQYDADFAALRNALDLPYRNPIQYDLNWDMGITGFSALRQLARVLDAKAGSAMRAGNIDESISCQADILRLARSANHSGMLTHFLVGSAIEGFARAGMYRSLPKMNADQCKKSLRFLEEREQGREDFENVREREVVWMTKTYGWPNRLGYLVENLTNVGSLNLCETIDRKDQTIIRLLQLEFALRAYQLDHNRPPTKLSDLAPEYLSKLPDDPFALEPTPLRCSSSDGQFKLWSIGPDGKDDNGAPMTKNENGGYELQGPGDVWLADFFGPYESEKTAAGNGSNTPSDAASPAAAKEGNGPAD